MIRAKIRRGILLAIVTSLMSLSVQVVHAAVTWSASSPRDSFNRTDLNPGYDIENIDAAIFDNSTTDIWFFLNMKNLPSINIFNDARDSWGGVQIDTDFDGKADYSIALSGTTLRTDRSTVDGTAYRYSDKKYIDQCDVGVYTNIDEQKKWIGFTFTKSCINLPISFAIRGYADFIANDSTSFDYAPDDFFRVNLPGAGSSSSGSSSSSSSGKDYEIPSNISNSSTLAKNFTEPPANLTKLSESLLPSVVTVQCSNSSGTGWSAEVAMSKALNDDGYRSYVITNHHVIDDCSQSRMVTLVLNDKSTVPGRVIAWNESSDVAAVASKTLIPPMQWIGTSPKQGWWIGVIGSPLGKAGILTTGIISSVNSNSGTFTMTAAINPGNSGGPVFDSTGRVLGLATSKNLITANQIAEGFGNAHGVTLLCTSVIVCTVEKDPWGANSKYIAGPSAADIDALAKAEAEAKAKAEAEAKAKAEADARAALEEKLREEKVKNCLDFNGDLNLVLFTLNSSKSLYPKSQSIFQGLLASAPQELNCSSINLQTFDSQIINQRKILSALQISTADAVANAKLISTRKTTITCVKGKLTKKVTAIDPKCPTGYKKK